MLDLSVREARNRLTGQNEEDDPVHDQDRPEDWDVEELEPTAEEGDDNGPGRPVPELELREAADEGLELLILLCGQSAYGTILHLIVDRFIRGVELGLEEGQEQVEKIDSKGVGNCKRSAWSFLRGCSDCPRLTNVPSLRDEDSQEEK